MQRRARQRGMAPLIASLLLAGALGAWVSVEIARFASGARRDALSERALAQAREGLIAYAADRPITSEVGPGYLPCPDIDGDGWAEPICGSLDGDRGQAERLGRLPWKTLGLADLRDGHGERLWYAVSTKYKGLLNCAASARCVDMTPPSALATITVRDALGAVTHDGTLADGQRPGAAAVVIAPGPALSRARPDGAPAPQRRDCPAGECDATGRCITQPAQRAVRCDPANYLDAAAGEDNAAFRDRLDAARGGNTDGFIHGPVRDSQGEVRVNDRLAVLTARDLMPRVMKRIAIELALCLRFYASRPENGGRYPWPLPACGSGATPAYGRLPDTPFEATLASSQGAMLDRWWRHAPRIPERLAELPTAAHACRAAVPPDDAGAVRTLAPGTPDMEGASAGRDAHSWWNAWRPFVFYAPAAGFAPSTQPPACGGARCLELTSEDGRRLGADKQFAIVVSRTPHACGSPALACDAARCTGVRMAGGAFPDHVAIALP